MFSNLPIIAGVQTSFVKSNFPAAIFSIRSSEPATSAPLFLLHQFCQSHLGNSYFVLFPEPFGKLTIVLKLKSPPLDCFKLIFKDTSIDSSNLVIKVFN